MHTLPQLTPSKLKKKMYIWPESAQQATGIENGERPRKKKSSGYAFFGKRHSMEKKCFAVWYRDTIKWEMLIYCRGFFGVCFGFQGIELSRWMEINSMILRLSIQISHSLIDFQTEFGMSKHDNKWYTSRAKDFCSSLCNWSQETEKKRAATENGTCHSQRANGRRERVEKRRSPSSIQLGTFAIWIIKKK